MDLFSAHSCRPNPILIHAKPARLHPQATGEPCAGCINNGSTLNCGPHTLPAAAHTKSRHAYLHRGPVRGSCLRFPAESGTLKRAVSGRCHSSPPPRPHFVQCSEIFEHGFRLGAKAATPHLQRRQVAPTGRCRQQPTRTSVWNAPRPVRRRSWRPPHRIACMHGFSGPDRGIVKTVSPCGVV